MPAPARPKIYHITHVNNLASIVRDGCLWSDAIMIQRQGVHSIGMGSIKQRRLGLPVPCHPGTVVGSSVPFNFCPRSVMLYVIHRANHPELTYREGQGAIVHLEADLHQAVRWAEANRRRWAFSLSNAGALYAQFRASLEQLDEVNWTAVAAIDFRPNDIKEGKQAEFLVERSFGWELVERIGVHSPTIRQQAMVAIQGAAHRPSIEVQPRWYY